MACICKRTCKTVWRTKYANRTKQPARTAPLGCFGAQYILITADVSGRAATSIHRKDGMLTFAPKHLLWMTSPNFVNLPPRCSNVARASALTQESSRWSPTRAIAYKRTSAIEKNKMNESATDTACCHNGKSVVENKANSIQKAIAICKATSVQLISICISRLGSMSDVRYHSAALFRAVISGCHSAGTSA